ncbi:MAG: polymerase, sigma 54 subunit, RpoN [Hyphomicrobiales bacterium]|nr:polymerase, sigma 54 subunit, RpoN [Hyphomicrobiales bacterium]
MALSTKLMLRQGQSLVMTPQLLQAIKLLQFSNVELSAFVEEELERNPLLERADERTDPIVEAVADSAERWGEDGPDGDPGDASRQEGDWATDTMVVDRQSLESDLGTEVGNSFDSDRLPASHESQAGPEGSGLSATSWNGASGGNGDGEPANLEAYVAARLTLHDHLTEQLSLAVTGATERLIGHSLIDAVDEAGYLTETVDAIAERLGASPAAVAAVLDKIQQFDPAGIAARNLSECLGLQLRERNRLDPAMQALLDHLPLLAKRDFTALRKLCGVDEEDFAEMVAEVRRLDPKPGRAYGGGVIQSVVPDVTVRAAPDGSWHIELNPEGLPRVLVNQTYAARVSRLKGNAADKSFVANCLQTANWLTKSLEQRARTILKVSTEIVRQQDAFFAHGVEHLRPLNLKTIADAIGMHESTVSRVTSNKYMASPRGLFELKYFFTASIPARSGGESHSAEAVRFRIKQLVDHEPVSNVLSDDAIVVKLKEQNIDIARRTVAKYRESLRIPSSVERRREKMAMQR